MEVKPEAKIGSTPTRARKVKFQDEIDMELDGIARKVINIDGNPLLPRRGKFVNTVLGSQSELGEKVQSSSGNQISDQAISSYAAKLQSDKSKNGINFRFLDSLDKQQDVDVVLPRESVKVVQDKLAFTLYGYFLGDRVAYPVVEHFVRLNWKKYGIQKVMMNANGFFFFKFTDNKGMLDVLEGGPWLIRNKPIVLNVWNPTSTLKKEDIKRIAVWVKLHDVPLAAYTDDGLSMLASKIGTPKLLDSYTTSMCADNWGRSSYARALIEISAEQEFKEALSVAIPEMDGEKYCTHIVDVEYEWKPPRCSHCYVFGHGTDACPQKACTISEPAPKICQDGFTEVKGRNAAKKNVFQVKNQKPKFEYRPLDYKKMVGARPSTSGVKNSAPSKLKIQNSFNALNSDTLEDGGNLKSSKEKGRAGKDKIEDVDEDEVEVIYDETKTSNRDKIGATSSSSVVSNG